MRIRDILAAVYDAFSRDVPKAYRKHQWRMRFSFLQVYFASPAIHYEVWVQKKTGRIEIGLHFEGERDENYRWAATLAGRAVEIQGRLGPTVELEEWTQTWTRLHETRAIGGALTQELAEATAARLAQFIDVLEPVLAEERAGASA